MADIAVTASSVAPGTGANVKHGIAGEAITAGEPIYIDTTDGNEVKLADANASEATAVCKGIALNDAASGQYVTYAESGKVTFNAVLAAGKVYVVSATPGGIAPVADLATGWRTTILGVAESTTSLVLGIRAYGIVN